MEQATIPSSEFDIDKYLKKYFAFCEIVDQLTELAEQKNEASLEMLEAFKEGGISGRTPEQAKRIDEATKVYAEIEAQIEKFDNSTASAFIYTKKLNRKLYGEDSEKHELLNQLVYVPTLVERMQFEFLRKTSIEHDVQEFEEKVAGSTLSEMALCEKELRVANSKKIHYREYFESGKPIYQFKLMKFFADVGTIDFAKYLKNRIDKLSGRESETSYQQPASCKWVGTKAELAELAIALSYSEKIKREDSPLSQNEIGALLGQMFGVDLKRVEDHFYQAASKNKIYLDRKTFTSGLKRFIDGRLDSMEK